MLRVYLRGFLNLYFNYGLHQFVHKPTRLNSVLDFVFCNDYNCVFNSRSVDPFGTSENNRVRFDIPLTTAQRVRISANYNFKYADWVGMNFFYLKWLISLICSTVLNRHHQLLSVSMMLFTHVSVHLCLVKVSALARGSTLSIHRLQRFLKKGFSLACLSHI